MKFFKFLFFLFFFFLILFVFLFFNLFRKTAYISYIDIPPTKGGYYLLNLEKNLYNLTKLDYFVLKLYIKYFYRNKTIKFGKYLVNTSLNPFEFIDYVYCSYPSLEKITIYPGDDIFKIAKVLDKKNICKEKEFLNFAFDKYFLKTLTGKDIFSFEGFIKPDTYTFSLYENPKNIISYLFSYYEKKLFEFLNKHKKLKGYLNVTNETSIKELDSNKFKKLYNLMKVASLLEKETSNYTEMYLISSVIYNRLKIHMPLQLDPTYFYEKKFEKYKKKLGIENKNISFNTYKIYGLPTTPISTFKLKTLLPAAFPKKTNYLFFVKKSKTSHAFSTSYKIHLENVKKYYRKKSFNP